MAREVMESKLIKRKVCAWNGVNLAANGEVAGSE